jgi:hypothetical protein
MKTTKNKTDEFFKMVSGWLTNDIVKAGTNYNYIEKKDEAFVRGYRAALLAVVRKGEEWFEENYLI